MAMLHLLQVLTVMFVAVAMGLSLAHALELPGKLRLGREAYVVMQRVYYPGFTIGGGIGEGCGIIATLVLLLATPWGGLPFWLTLGGFLLMLVMHAVYWLYTHPVNRFWVEGVELSGPGAAFFAAGQPHDGDDRPDWDALRNQWEYSHVARAVLAGISLALIAAAISL